MDRLTDGKADTYIAPCYKQVRQKGEPIQVGEVTLKIFLTQLCPFFDDFLLKINLFQISVISEDIIFHGYITATLEIDD